MISVKPAKILSIVIGVLISFLIIFMGFRLMQKAFTRASDTIPRDVVVSELTGNSAKVGWSTDIESQGVIEYGTSPTALNFYAPEASRTKIHLVDLTLLSPNTTYYFQIRIGDTKADNGGVPWTFSTKTNTNTNASPNTNNPQTIVPTSAIIPTTSTQVVPTTANNQPTALPTQSVSIPNTDSSAVLTCGETDCVKICQKLTAGTGCGMSDFYENDCSSKVKLDDCTLK